MDIHHINTDNYFTFYGIPKAFHPDIDAIKREYLKYARNLHPDFFTQTNQDEQDQAMMLSSYNNEAYQTLNNDQKRMRYLLILEELIDPDDKTNPALPPEFLMEVMDFNEKIMDQKMEGDEAGLEESRKELEGMTLHIEQELAEWTQRYDGGEKSREVLQNIYDIYLKTRYLRRIEQNVFDKDVEL